VLGQAVELHGPLNGLGIHGIKVAWLKLQALF
jgi:hypothetical protein